MKRDERELHVITYNGMGALTISWVGMGAIVLLSDLLGAPLLSDYLDVGLVLLLSMGYFFVANARAGVRYDLVGRGPDGRPRWWWYVVYPLGFLVLDAIIGRIEGPGDVIGRLLFYIVFVRVADWALGVFYKYWEQEVGGEDQPGHGDS